MKQLFLFALLLFAVNIPAQQVDDNLLTAVGEQLLKKDDLFAGRYPEYTVNGEWKYRDKVNWLSGFAGGELWYMYQMTRDDEFKTRALAHADALLPYAGIDYTHDMGFIFLPTLWKAWQHTGNTKYLKGALKAAEMLAARFNENGEFLRAWGRLGEEKKAGWVIIDTMMNLELLYAAAEQAGIDHYYDAAYRHALTTLSSHIRDDYSSYHVAEFDPESGELQKQRTHQGAEDETTWARGQAWGIYGYTLSYKHTGDQRFLHTAKRMADYFLAALPEDHVPYWDLDLAGDDVVRDASAAAIAASGLFMLADLVSLRTDAEKYSRAAVSIVESLIRDYTFKSSTRPEEQGILIHTVYNYHKDWGVDESFPCGDYYFIESLYRLREYTNAHSFRHAGSRETTVINNDWAYLEDACKTPADLPYTTAEWMQVELPHTWNAFDTFDSNPGYRRSAGWYAKEFVLTGVSEQQPAHLYFEGANTVADVYVNGSHAGSHIGGYTGFAVDITPYVIEGNNKVLVRVDNSVDRDIVPSQKSDFFIYGGLFRDVELRLLPGSSIEDITITTPSVNAAEATTEVLVEVTGETAGMVVLGELITPAGKTTATAEAGLSEGKAELKFPAVASPQLWSPDSPSLYTCKITLKDGNAVVDMVEDRIGYRWFEFKPHGAFYLNGERLLLRGTHRHEDHAGLGSAIPDSLDRRDMELIKGMGANFVRLGHYPQDPVVYEACDELGLLVWDEVPWCRGGVGGERWKELTMQMLREMIDQNRNHPSIIMWSLGNEIYWLPDFEGGGNIDSLRAFLTEMNEEAHRLDSSRPTCVRKFYEGADIVDVFSPSIWSGWYSGVYTNYERALTDAISKYERFFHAEYGGSSHIGRHTETPVTGEGFVNPDEWAEAVNQVKVKNIAKLGEWSESYIVDLFDWHLQVGEHMENFTGNAQWAFKDFGTPLRPENAIPYLNQKGLTDREGNPKDAYYVFKSYWTESPQFCYIESHTWNERSGPEGTPREVAVYSNCDVVELFHNGVSLGVKDRAPDVFPASGFTWQVQFAEGANSIEAVGYAEGVMLAGDSITVKYSFEKNTKPSIIELSAVKLKADQYLVTATARDKNGLRCLDYEDNIYFSTDGEGELKKYYGLPAGSDIIQFANGKASVILTLPPNGVTVIEARNQDFKGSYLHIVNGYQQ